MKNLLQRPTKRVIMDGIFQTMLGTIMLCLPHFSYAQDDLITNEFPSLAPSSVYITSHANRTLSFGLRPNGGKWRTYKIESGQSETFQCVKCEEFEFSMKTENQPLVNYKLKSEKRYVLEWNREKELWDLFIIKR